VTLRRLIDRLTGRMGEEPTAQSQVSALDSADEAAQARTAQAQVIAPDGADEAARVTMAYEEYIAASGADPSKPPTVRKLHVQITAPDGTDKASKANAETLKAAVYRELKAVHSPEVTRAALEEIARKHGATVDLFKVE
jgi:hypothetical protein